MDVSKESLRKEIHGLLFSFEIFIFKIGQTKYDEVIVFRFDKLHNGEKRCKHSR